jgi:hypothetical protein
VFRQRQPHTGVLCFRLASTQVALRLARLAEVLATYSDHLDQFVVVTERSIPARRS